MTCEDWLLTSGRQLTEAGIESARLDTLLLLEDCLGRERSWLLAHPEHALAPDQLTLLQGQLERRLQHEPLAYIRGFVEFYGRRFTVSPAVLVPRPESEAMIGLLKKLAPAADSIADIGTGSGCLAITAALETQAVVYGIDIDEKCLKVARKNSASLHANVSWLAGSLTEPLPEIPEVLLANLPYVPDDYAINKAARHEPSLALFAGNDGLDVYRDLFIQLAARPCKLLITESLLEQHQALVLLAEQHGYKLVDTDGLAQAFQPV